MTLAELKPGERAKITQVDVFNYTLRIMELGLFPGVIIGVSSVAPLGDPIVIQLESSALSIRKADAMKIQIEKI